MSSLTDTQLATARAFIDGYNSWTIEGLLRSRTDDCVHAMLPASLNRPDRNNEEYAKFFAQLEGLMKNFHITIHKIVNDPTQHLAVVHASGYGETPVGEYRNEYAYFLYFTEDGGKVRRVEKFVDSAFSGAFFGRVGEYFKAGKREEE